MRTIIKICLLVALAAVVSGQIVNLSQIFTPQTQATLGAEYQDPQFLATINNYFGCKTWKDGVCVECSANYIFNSNKICCQIDEHCEVFNRAAGVCESCYTGFYIDALGTCTAHAPSDPARAGCAQWKKNVCEACSAKHYFDANKVCQAVDSQCREWDSSNGHCTSCYFGYEPVNGSCIENSPLKQEVAANPHCKEWNQGKCNACAHRYYFDATGVCQPVDTQCNTWDNADGHCLTCYAGYDSVNGTCVYSPSNTAAPSDAGCKTWQNGTCLECSGHWVFNAQGVCVPVSGLCLTHHTADGNCLTCYKGYELVNGSCEFSASNNQKPTDGGCADWDWNNQVCKACSKNWVADSNGICVPVNDQCRTHDDKGACTGCWAGYDVVDAHCVFSPSNNDQPAQRGCKVWDWNARTCKECAPWWYVAADGLCTEVSALCASYNSLGACDSCYPGYSNDNGVCVRSAPQPVSDTGCKTWSGSVCQACSDNWVKNAAGACVPVSDQCRSHDLTTGWCTSCYKGYDLTEAHDANGKVTDVTCNFSPSNTAPVSDPGCKDWVDGKCTGCSSNWWWDSNSKVCSPVSNDCASYDASNGNCLTCYKGYDLVNGSCVYSPSNTQGPADKGCRSWSNGACDACGKGWYLGVDANKVSVCVRTSDQCASYDANNGNCLTCYKGYDLVNGSCAYSPSNTHGPNDKGCKEWTNGACSLCSDRWAFDSNGVCQAVSDACKTHTGLACTSCWNGFVLNNGSCELSPLNSQAPTDAGCSDWDWNNQVCRACGPYWYKDNSNGHCAPVSSDCKTYDNANGKCLTCWKGYLLNEASGACERAPEQPVTDLGCADWDWNNQVCRKCSQYWFSNNGVCQKVSPDCNGHDTNGRCTACYTGYSLDAQGACQQDAVTTCKASDQSGCTKCYDGFVLYQHQCISLDKIADIALYYAECCPQKLAQLRAEGRLPK